MSPPAGIGVPLDLVDAVFYEELPTAAVALYPAQRHLRI